MPPTDYQISQAGNSHSYWAESTYLYMAPREYVIEETSKQIVDDVKGYPEGHFVLIYGYDHATQLVTIMDPLRQKSLFTRFKVYDNARPSSDGNHAWRINLRRQPHDHHIQRWSES